jgi:hypothetical protein
VVNDYPKTGRPAAARRSGGAPAAVFIPLTADQVLSELERRFPGPEAVLLFELRERSRLDDPEAGGWKLPRSKGWADDARARWAQRQKRGFGRLRREHLRRMAEWYCHRRGFRPGGNLGLLCPEDELIVDADNRRARRGMDTLARRAKTQITAKGEDHAHYVFRIPPGIQIKTDRHIELPTLGIEIDTRAALTGYIVVEPSLGHDPRTGQAGPYRFLRKRWPQRPPRIPDVLLSDLQTAKRVGKPRRLSAHSSERGTTFHSREHPCPVCRGGTDIAHHATDPGQVGRCFGLLDASGLVAFCSDARYAGKLEPNERMLSNYEHHLYGWCSCARHARHDGQSSGPSWTSRDEFLTATWASNLVNLSHEIAAKRALVGAPAAKVEYLLGLFQRAQAWRGAHPDFRIVLDDSDAWAADCVVDDVDTAGRS